MILSRWRWFVRHVLRRSTAEAELDEEIRAHLALEAARLTEAGVPPSDARQQASRGFGNVPLIKDVTRETWGWSVCERTWRNVQSGVRTLRKRPGFTAVAVLSLALGIGANTTIFSLINTIILRDLPFARPSELVDVRLQLPDVQLSTLSYPNYADLRDATTGVFVGTAGSFFTSARVGLDASTVAGEAVTGNYFSVLGLVPALGRSIEVVDDRTRGAHPVVMLSYGYWHRAFAGDPDVVGRTLRLDGRDYAIIGVAPQGYRGILRGLINPSFYVPMMMVGRAVGHAGSPPAGRP